MRNTGVVVLASVVALAASGCQQRPGGAAPATGQPSAAARSAGMPAGSEPAGVLALLPGPTDLAGWSRPKAPRRFGPDDLWEHIDGAAETYLDFDFQELATAEYRSQAAGDVVSDIFLMASPVDAFGIYAQEKSPECELVAIGVEGCYGGGMLRFWSGAHYVKLTALKAGANIQQALVALAGCIQQRLGPPGDAPSQLRLFPAADLVPGSIRYLPKDVLGQSYLEKAFQATYARGGASWSLLLMTLESPEAAAGALTRYRQFMAASGKPVRALSAPGDGGFRGTDPFHGPLIAVRSGATLAIALGVPSDEVGLAQARQVMSSLR